MLVISSRETDKNSRGKLSRLDKQLEKRESIKLFQLKIEWGKKEKSDRYF